MDFLKGEIERKRKMLQEVAGNKRYVKQGDLEKKRVEEYLREHQPKAVVVAATTTNKKVELPIEPNNKLEEAEIVLRFRLKEHPIRLFGESDQERLDRLASIERTDTGPKLANEWSNIIEKTQKVITEDLLKGEGVSVVAEPVPEDESVDTTVISRKLLESDLPECSRLISIYMQRLVREWHLQVNSLSSSIKQTANGRDQMALQAQTEEHLKPLYKMLRKQTVDFGVYCRLTDIISLMQEREYQLANDVYYQLAIGNAAWPIGLTESSKFI